MKSALPLAVVIIVLGAALGNVASAPAQVEGGGGATDAELQAAALSRRESPAFNQRLEELQLAARLRDEAIASIPEVRTIDAELARLQERLRELMKLREEAVARYAATLAPLEREVERLQGEVLAADPVRQVLDQQSSARSSN